MPKGAGPPANVVSSLKVTISKFTIDTDATDLARMSPEKRREKKESVHGSGLMHLINVLSLKDLIVDGLTIKSVAQLIVY